MTPQGDIDEDFFQSGAEVNADQDSPAAAAPLPPRLGLLAELASAEFDMVARAARLTFHPDGHVIFQQGDEADRFFILVDGAVQVERDGELLATLGPGAFFGEIALLVGGRRSATVQTVGDSSLWSVSYAAFDAAVSHHLMADDAAGAEVERRIAQTPRGAFDERA